MIPPFIIDFLIKSGIYLIIMWLTGILVIYRNVKVNYTRKINHFALLVVPFLMNIITRRPPATSTSSSNSFVDVIVLMSGLLFFVLLTKPIRSRIRFLDVAFRGIDRPEDRPYTLLWMTIQTAGNYLATIPISAYLTSIGKPQIIFILILINGIGDGLAEPVGIRFGKHKYVTNALFTKQTYTRSMEGSLCVFCVSIISLVIFQGMFSTGEFLSLMIFLPIVMTVTEAKAPHTLDNPLMFLTGSGVIYFILRFVV
jgi:phytol kinase